MLFNAAVTEGGTTSPSSCSCQTPEALPPIVVKPMADASANKPTGSLSSDTSTELGNHTDVRPAGSRPESVEQSPVSSYAVRMKKFLVLYRASQSGFEQMMKSTPEQQKAGMDAWMSWSKSAAGLIADMGGPLGKALKVTKNGDATANPNDLGGYSILQAESKEALAAKLKGHPHFTMPDGWIEIVEIMPVPGM
jgi:hypothetical protein